ncbi:MAG: hypothetical protein JOZ26_21390 [Hyphomicrobiales bacterium]|nr:hypothetical protein [Hyphomicrobiales bacterium]
MKRLIAVAAMCACASSANAAYSTIDLSNYVNLGFQNSWFINGLEFTTIIGTTHGNQGSSVPFNVATSPTRQTRAETTISGSDCGADLGINSTARLSA